MKVSCARAAEIAELRKDAARGRWLIEWLTQQGLLHALFCQPDGRKAPTGDYWVLQRAAMVSRDGCEGYGKTEEAAIDSAMAASAAVVKPNAI